MYSFSMIQIICFNLLENSLSIILITTASDGWEGDTDCFTESLQIRRHSAHLVQDTPGGQFHRQDDVVVNM